MLNDAAWNVLIFLWCVFFTLAAKKNSNRKIFSKKDKRHFRSRIGLGRCTEVIFFFYFSCSFHNNTEKREYLHNNGFLLFSILSFNAWLTDSERKIISLVGNDSSTFPPTSMPRPHPWTVYFLLFLQCLQIYRVNTAKKFWK